MTHLILADSIEIISKEAYGILLFLLPGFITAWVFFGLTAYPKKEPFERLVQAFIFTMFIKVMNIGCRKVWWVWWHKSHPAGVWYDENEVFSSTCNALLLGLVVSICANSNIVHGLLRRLNVTDRNSRPPNTYNGLDKKRRYVVLTLKDSRRVFGWAREFPDEYDKGVFILEDVRWVDTMGIETPQPEVDSTIISVSDVKMVQFLAEATGTGEEVSSDIGPSPLPEQVIAKRAYSIWEREKDIRDKQDWYQAEGEIKEEKSV